MIFIRKNSYARIRLILNIGLFMNQGKCILLSGNLTSKSKSFKFLVFFLGGYLTPSYLAFYTELLGEYGIPKMGLFDLDASSPMAFVNSIKDGIETAKNKDWKEWGKWEEWEKWEEWGK